MNQQQLSGSGPPIASSSRLPPIKSLQHNHPYDDQDQAQAAAALLQIKRSPSAVHAPLLPSFQEIHSAYSNAYPTPGSNGAEPSTNNLFPYLPPIRTDFQQYKPQGTSSAGPSTAAPAYFPSAHSHTSPTTFLPYQFTPNSAQPHSPASPPRKRKRSTLLELAPREAAPPSDHNGKGKYRESELPIDVEGDGDQEMRSEVKGAGSDEPEGEVRCICGYNVDDGFTIQCERCHVWQHAACFSIPSIDAVPDVYLCERCNPYPSTHRPLDYEGARRLQQQRLGLASKNGGTLGLENSGAVIGAGVGPPTPAVRGGARKRRTGSPKVERKTRGGASGAARRRGSSATSHPHASADDASGSGGGRKVAAASGRRKELESSANTAALQHHQRQNPLHPSHQNNTMDPPFTAAPQPPHQPATHSHSFAPLDCTQNTNKPWTQQYVPITRDIVHPAVQPVLRSFAHTWRGVTAFSDAETNTNDELSPLTSCIPMPAPTLPADDTPTADTRKTFLHPLSSPLTPPVRPPTYTLHALRPIARQSYVVPYTCAITPSREYLREPTSQYAQLGVPKQGVHLVPPPLELCLDARGVGGEGRWVRSGCHPNAVLRPVVCERGKQASQKKGMTGVNTMRGGDDGGRGERTGGGLSGEGVGERTFERNDGEVSGKGGGADGRSGSRAETEDVKEGEGDESPPDVTFGVFAIRDLKAEEEIVLGWEWDDRHVVHELPRLLKEGYGSGTPALKRAMGEVLSTLFSTFTTCACGASAHNCAITQMQKFADLDLRPDFDPNPDPDPDLLPHEQQQYRTSNLRDQRPQPSPDLGPLIGATRGLRTTDRGQGGREGVEPVSSTSGHAAPSVESVARAFRGVASDSGSDAANSHAMSPSQKRVHFPTPPLAPEVVVSPATVTTIATPSPRKSWERRYSESRSIDTSEEEADEAVRMRKPPKKKARMTPRIDSPSVGEDADGDTPMLEEALPPKMRKNWIKETLRVLNTEGHELQEDHVSMQYEAMDAEGTDARVEHPAPLMEVDSPLVALQSPTTALAGLSLRGSPVDNRDVSLLRDPDAEVTEAPKAPEAPEVIEVTEVTEPPVATVAPEVSETPTMLQAMPSPPPSSVAISSPEKEVDATHSEAPPPPLSPIPSPIRPQSAEPPSLPIAAPKMPTPNMTLVSPLLPSSSTNVNLISSPTHHIPDAAPSTNEPPLSAPAPLAAPPSDSHNSNHEPPAQPAPSSPPPPPKKPPIKRRTLADWKSRKEKERIAQALLQPPTSKPSNSQDVGPASMSNNTTDTTKVTIPAAVDVPTPSTGLLAVNSDVHMDGTDNTGSSPSKSPTHERPKEHDKVKTSPPPQNLTMNDVTKETMEIHAWGREPDNTGGSVKLDMKPVSSTFSPSSPTSASLPLRPRLPPTGALPESSRPPPSHSPSSLPLRPIPLGSVPNSRRPPLATPDETSALTSFDVQELHKSHRPLGEDGEINVSHINPSPHLPPRPSSRPPSLPPSRAPSHPPSRPRSPPTQPRSFHASSPTPSLPRSSSPSFARGSQLPVVSSDQNANSRPRPVPSGPRALRQVYPPPSTSGSSSYNGRGYSRPPPSSRGSFHSHGRSYDRDSDRGWSSRGRGRGGEWR